MQENMRDVLRRVLGEQKEPRKEKLFRLSEIVLKSPLFSALELTQTVSVGYQKKEVVGVIESVRQLGMALREGSSRDVTDDEIFQKLQRVYRNGSLIIPGNSALVGLVLMVAKEMGVTVDELKSEVVV